LYTLLRGLFVEKKTAKNALELNEAKAQLFVSAFGEGRAEKMRNINTSTID
jgi:hypothetical protein